MKRFKILHFTKLRFLLLLKEASISFLFAVFLMLILWMWSGVNFSFFLESNLLKWTSIIKNTVLPSGEKDIDKYRSDVVFINTAPAKKLIPDETGTGYKVITDRILLDSLFRVLNEYPQKKRYIICDLVFEDETEDDSMLASTISKSPDIYFPTPAFAENAINKAILEGHHGFANYSITNEWAKLSGDVIKLQLMRSDSTKNLSLVLYENYTGTKASLSNGLLWINEHPFTKNIVVDETIRSNDITDAHNKLIMPSLDAALLSLSDKEDDSLINQFAGKTFVVVGDFESDKHKTAFGEVPGTLIIFNNFLSLIKKENKIDFAWILLLLAGFTGIFHFAIYGERTGSRFHRWNHTINRIFGAIPGDLFWTGLLTWAISIVSYLIFNITVEVVAAAIFISAILFFRKLILNIFTVTQRKRKLTLGKWITLFITAEIPEEV